MRIFRSVRFILLLCIVFGIGTFGYRWIEGWSYFDAWYMTAITLTTTGFAEVHDLSEAGRIFTIFLMVCGVSTFTWIIREIFASQLSIDFKNRRRRAMKAKIKELKDHAIVCGFGRMGKVICEELANHGSPFVVIEREPAAIEELRLTDYLWVDGDASDDNDLIEVNVESAKVLVIVIDSDADALYTLMAVRSLNPNIHSICRANNETAKNRLKRLGADKVVLPLATSALNVARSVLHPSFENMLDVAESGVVGDGTIQFIELPINEQSKAAHKKLSETRLGCNSTDFVVVGVQRPKTKFSFSPETDFVLMPGDRVIGFCRKADHDDFRAEFA